MEYFIVFFLQLLGILFHVAQKVNALDKQYPEKTIKQIYGQFFENDWSSLSVSVLVLVTDLVTHGILNTYFPGVMNTMVNVPMTEIQVPLIVLSFIGAFVLGYAGQRLAYKYLGKAEQYLNDKVDKK